METLGLNVYSLPEHPIYISECPDHPSAREYFLAYMTGLQLIWRIEEKFPEAITYSPQLAMLLLYNAILQAKEEQEKDQSA